VKDYYFIIALLFSPLGLLAQVDGTEIPYAIKVHFMEEYISASGVSWDKNANNHYIARFYHQSHFKKATYIGEGILLVLETELTSLVQVPLEVQRAINKRHKFYSVDKIWKSQIADEVTLNFLIRKDKIIYELKFHPSGKLMSKVKIESFSG
jgi:hypothetical protein